MSDGYSFEIHDYSGAAVTVPESQAAKTEIVRDSTLTARARALSEQIEKTDRKLKRLYAEREAIFREMLAKGMSMNEIGKQLGISAAAVGMAVGRYRSRKGSS